MSKFSQGALCILIAAAFAGGAIAAPCSGPQADAQPITSDTKLTLDIVLEQVRGASPSVRRAALETRARKADAAQAGRRLNPSIGLEVENFSGSGPLAGFDQSETTLSIEQTFLENKSQWLLSKCKSFAIQDSPDRAFRALKLSGSSGAGQVSHTQVRRLDLRERLSPKSSKS